MLEATILDQVRSIFQPLEARYTFHITCNPEHEQAGEMIDFLNDIASCSDKLSCQVTETDEPKLEFTLLKEGKETGIKFRAVPGGHEFSSLLLAVLNADGKGKNLPDEGIGRRIKALQGPIHLQTYVSLACTNCPDIVQALNAVALLHPHITHDTIDGAVFQEEADALKIQAVPSVYANGKQLHVGRGSLGELLKKLEDTFDMSTMHIIMMDKNISNANKTTLMKDIEKVDGVKWAFGLNSVFGANVPASMIPKDVKDMLQSDEQELVFVCSKYSSATDESNSQIAAINDLVKKYDSNGMVIGEAPLMKDLQDVTDIDLVNVNVASVAAIFIIIMLVFKSISVPIILVAVIEFAINVNMAIPFFQGIELPFVASIVVGTIQLGATVDYAILMTSRYQKERRKGSGKKEAVMNAHKACALSIMTSGFSFFAATFGVAWYSKVDMIGAICTLLSRGALISMACVIFILPAMFIIFDKVICKTSIDFLGEKAKVKAAARA